MLASVHSWSEFVVRKYAADYAIGFREVPYQVNDSSRSPGYLHRLVIIWADRPAVLDNVSSPSCRLNIWKTTTTSAAAIVVSSVLGPR